MDINQLKYFKTVADSGKITTAAQNLFVTPPAISSSIAALEQELGVKLFERSGNRLVLNRQGKIFLQYANHILESVADARGDLMESLGEGARSVVVGATSSCIFADLFSDFMKDHPQIPLTSSTIPLRHINSAGLNLRFSFLFAAETEPPAEYAARCQNLFLFEDAPALMLNPEHPLAKKEFVTVEELSGKELIWPRTNYGMKNLFLKEFDSRRLPPPRFTYHHYHTVHTAVQKNVGMALMTLRCQSSMNQNFVFLPVKTELCRWKHHLFWRSDHALTPEDNAFLDFVKKYYSI